MKLSDECAQSIAGSVRTKASVGHDYNQDLELNDDSPQGSLVAAIPPLHG
jgi:hypothetical protein